MIHWRKKLFCNDKTELKPNKRSLRFLSFLSPNDGMKIWSKPVVTWLDTFVLHWCEAPTIRKTGRTTSADICLKRFRCLMPKKLKKVWTRTQGCLMMFGIILFNTEVKENWPACAKSGLVVNWSSTRASLASIFKWLKAEVVAFPLVLLCCYG